MIPKINNLEVKVSLNNNDLFIIEDANDNFKKKKLFASSIPGGNNLFYATLGENINAGTPVYLEDKGSGYKLYKIQKSNDYVKYFWFSNIVFSSFVPSVNRFVELIEPLFDDNNLYLSLKKIDGVNIIEVQNVAVDVRKNNTLSVNTFNDIGAVAYFFDNDVLRVKCFTVTPNNISFGNYVDLQCVDYIPYVAVALSSSKIVCFVNEFLGLRRVVFNVSNNSISLSSDTLLSLDYWPVKAVFVDNKFVLLAVKNNKNFLLFFDSNGNYLSNVALPGNSFSISNVDDLIVCFSPNSIFLVKSDGSEMGAPVYVKVDSVCKLSSNSICVYQCFDDRNCVLVLERNGLSLSVKNNIPVLPYVSVPFVFYVDGLFYVCGAGSLGTHALFDVSNFKAHLFFGILEESGLSGALRPVAVRGCRAYSINGLIPGGLYFLDFFGSISGAGGPFLVLQALSPDLALVL